MAEIKYEIIKKIGVPSNPLRPSDTSPKSKNGFGGSQALGVFCTINQMII